MLPVIAAFLSNWPVVLFAVLSAAVYYAKRNQQQQNGGGLAAGRQQAQWRNRPTTALVQKVTPQPAAIGSSLPVQQPVVGKGIKESAVSDNSFAHSPSVADSSRLDLKPHTCIPSSKKEAFAADASDPLSRIPVALVSSTSPCF